MSKEFTPKKLFSSCYKVLESLTAGRKITWVCEQRKGEEREVQCSDRTDNLSDIFSIAWSRLWMPSSGITCACPLVMFLYCRYSTRVSRHISLTDIWYSATPHTFSLKKSSFLQTFQTKKIEEFLTLSNEDNISSVAEARKTNFLGHKTKLKTKGTQKGHSTLHGVSLPHPTLPYTCVDEVCDMKRSDTIVSLLCSREERDLCVSLDTVPCFIIYFASFPHRQTMWFLATATDRPSRLARALSDFPGPEADKSSELRHWTLVLTIASPSSSVSFIRLHCCLSRASELSSNFFFPPISIRKDFLLFFFSLGVYCSWW